MAGVARLTFGNSQLLAGIEMIPVLIGLFAVTEVLKQTNAKKRLSAEDGVAGTKGRVNTKMPSLREMWSIKWVMLRCSIVGHHRGHPARRRCDHCLLHVLRHGEQALQVS